jgi:hypothetical protein
MTHRKLGLLGIALAVAVVAVGLSAGIASARAGVTPLPELPPLAFLIMPVAEMVVFATLFTAAIALRKAQRLAQALHAGRLRRDAHAGPGAHAVHP